MIENMNKTKSCFLERIKKIGKPLAEEKREDTNK